MDFEKDEDSNNTYTNCSAYGDKSKDLEIFKHADLLKLVGVRRKTISNLENGRYNPSLELAWNIAKIFNVSIEDIFNVIDE